MKEAIKSNLQNPENLEKLYRSDKSLFKEVFLSIYSEIEESSTSIFWYHRLTYKKETSTSRSNSHWLILILMSLIAWFIAKIPSLSSIDESFYYTRNFPYFFLPFITIYFLWIKKTGQIKWLGILTIYIITLIFINTLPNTSSSSTLMLSVIHQPIFFWFIAGFAFTGRNYQDTRERLNFLRFNGDLIVMSAVLLLSGIVLTGITLGLFSLVSISIEEFYMQNIAVWGLVTIPIVSTYLVQSNPQLVNKVSPIIARIFTPLVSITLLLFLFATIFSGKNPTTDREFLVVFNGLLIGVMALIFFSNAELKEQDFSKWNEINLFLLSALTLIVNAIALAAIIYRIGEWGISPNRIAVLGSNILMFMNLGVIFYHQLKMIKSRGPRTSIEKWIARFLPIYGIWTALILFIFPFLFWFR